jgi:hypothetical protein
MSENNQPYLVTELLLLLGQTRVLEFVYAPK